MLKTKRNTTAGSPWNLLLMAAVLFIASLGLLFFLIVSRGLPPLEQLERYTPTLSSRVSHIRPAGSAGKLRVAKSPETLVKSKISKITPPVGT